MDENEMCKYTYIHNTYQCANNHRREWKYEIVIRSFNDRFHFHPRHITCISSHSGPG